MASHSQKFPLLVAFAFFCEVSIGHASDSKYVESELGDRNHWTAAKWTPQEISLFGGLPTMAQSRGNTALVRYSYYVSQYSLTELNPVWVAHIDRFDSESKSRGRTKKHDKRWDRQGERFRPDTNIAAKAHRDGVRLIEDSDYVNANPNELPSLNAQKITRGHLASNLEMKCLGTPDEGDVSQDESFSLANACPQMNDHNRIIWAKLEHECLVWAARFHGAAVISGPIYETIQGYPPPAGKPLKTRSGISIPTAFFKVVIAENEKGKRSAIAFIVPHDATLKAADLKTCVRSVREVETKTGINFMPDLGTNDEIETRVPSPAEWGLN